MSIVRDNLMTQRGYTPYCGAMDTCRTMPRSFFNGKQFQCRACGWQSQFEAEFIEQYKAKWSAPAATPANVEG